MAIAFTRQGLLSNPDDFTLRNNLVFALALHGNIEEAQRALRKINPAYLNESERIVFEATSGLIAFRSGAFERGRALYRSAITRGKRLRDRRASIAGIYHTFEELRTHSPGAEEIRKEAIEGAAVLTEASYLALVRRLREYDPR